MNRLEELKVKLEKMGYKIQLSRHIQPDKTLENVRFFATKQYRHSHFGLVWQEAEELKELIPDHNAIEIRCWRNKEIQIYIHWAPDNSEFNPKTNENVEIIPPVCTCPEFTEYDE